jgi:hypothetical protein
MIIELGSVKVETKTPNSKFIPDSVAEYQFD